MIKFIADIGANHNGSFSRCENLIYEAKKIGCWGVKFQLYKSNKLYNFSDKPDGLDGTELPETWIPEIKRICNELKIYFGCSPFDLRAVGILAHHVDFLKIASYEILRLDLISECAKTGLPLHVSTGFASMAEINNAIRTIGKTNHIYIDDEPKIILYHCIPLYPCNFYDCNLNKIIFFQKTLKEIHPSISEIGWSNHSAEEGVLMQAIMNGASIIEFHLDLNDGEGRETKAGHVLLAKKIEPLIANLKIGAMSSQISLTKKQISDYRLLRSDPTDGIRPHKELRK